jgi:hypothetical protein
VLIHVDEEMEREARIQTRATITEILAVAFANEDFPSTDSLKLLKKPLKMEDGAVFYFGRIQTVARLSLTYITWDNRELRFGVEVPRVPPLRKSSKPLRKE